MGKDEEVENSSSEEELDGNDMLDMIEKDDLEFIKHAVTSRSYHVFDKVRFSRSAGPKSKRQKLMKNDDAENFEEAYQEQITEDIPTKSLLPIKTKHGIIPQQTHDNADPYESHDDDDDDDLESLENEEFNFIDDKFDLSKPIPATDLLMERNKVLKEKKIHIGTLSAGLLEAPEEKVTNLRTLINIMDEETTEVYYTVRKLAMMSLLEVFKDILPSYQIKKAVNDGVKLRRDTLKLQKHEDNLINYYKKFLQRLEKYSLVLTKRNGVVRSNEEELKLAELAVHCMCELLVVHPYFNYAQNIAQTLVPLMNHHKKNIRELVKNSVKDLFKQDKKEEVTLQVLRMINKYLKNHAHNVHTDLLETFLVLKLKDVNLDQEKEQDIKQRKLTAKKHKVLQISKRERKRKKRLQALENELLETKAQESKKAKQENLTEITKIIFGIYFRILKSSNNSRLLGECLEGLSRFSHCINIDFYLDLVSTLDKLLKEEWIGYRERLHCIQTVFAVLSGVGEALNIEPTRFYTALYKDLLTVHASKTHTSTELLLRILNDSLIKRRKKISNRRIIAFVKRLSTLCLQLIHNGALAGLCLIKNLISLNQSVDVVLDLENTFGDGKFQAELEDPEYANASSTALYELQLMLKHYHPHVSKYAKHIAFGVPISGEGSLEAEFSHLSPEQLLHGFDMSIMAFNPPVLAPGKIVSKSKSQRHRFVDNSFKYECKIVLRSHVRNRSKLL